NGTSKIPVMTSERIENPNTCSIFILFFEEFKIPRNVRGLPTYIIAITHNYFKEYQCIGSFWRYESGIFASLPSKTTTSPFLHLSLMKPIILLGLATTTSHF